MKRKPLGLFSDRVHTIPRRWSNEQLQEYATLFDGDVANVSAWKDEDKEGNHYRDYFSNANSYTLTNFKAEARGFQGQEGEIFLDLEQDLPSGLEGRFDTVFNHTTLEHVLDVQKAFENLCLMSRESVIVVVPFLQQYHAPYGDFWRFTPLLIQKLFERHGLQLCYLNFNNHSHTSVYIFAIASRQPERYAETFGYSFSVVDPAGHGDEPFIGCRAVPNRLHRAKRMVESWIKTPLRLGRAA